MRSRKYDNSGGMTNFFLMMILLSMSGVPILAIGGSAIGFTALFGVLLIGALWQWIVGGLLVWALLRKFGWPIVLASLPVLWLWWLVCDPTFCLALTALLIVGPIGALAVGMVLRWLGRMHFIAAQQARSMLPARQAASSEMAMPRVGPEG